MQRDCTRVASAYSPSHITGFFAIFKNGSAGAGICLEKGMRTEVKSRGRGVDISINGKKAFAKTSRAVIKRFIEISGKKHGLAVEHRASMPIGYGCGMSGAGALSLALSLNKLLCLGLKKEECAEIAQAAEIECGTGLGTVAAELCGSLAYRKKPGEFTSVEKIRVPNSTHIVCSFFSPIPTWEVIRSMAWKRKITAVGLECIREFENEKTLDNFIQLSRQFAIKTGLAREKSKVRKLMDAIENASMAMLGETVFAVEKNRKDASATAKEMMKFSKNTVITRISPIGAHIESD
ncbi:MAG: hypothetical protein QXP42_01600 [Candidatus Micrarchaeia archaeon]